MAATGRRLAGKRILVTRPRERSAELCFLLEDEGAQVLALPVLELLPPEDPRPLQAAAEQLGRYSWVLFASPSAVTAMVEAARVAGTLGVLSKAKVAVVGPATARAAKEFGLSIAAEAATATGEGLAQTLFSHLGPDDSVLLPAAHNGRRELEEALSSAGYKVTRVTAYQSASSELDPAALEALSSAPLDAALFGSPRTVEALLEKTGSSGRIALEAARLIAIGPTTASAISALGLVVAQVAERPTAEALVEATVRAIHG